jgi:hypothetical protein
MNPSARAQVLMLLAVTLGGGLAVAIWAQVRWDRRKRQKRPPAAPPPPGDKHPPAG